MGYRYIDHRDNKMKRLIMLCMICFMTCNMIACSNRVEEYTSPSGENTITVKYDYASRPSVFNKGDCIWNYPGSGFNEEVFFDVEWLDDDTLKLINNDESHNGKYYEEYKIEL